MNTSKFVWIETFANAFKQNAINNKPDGSEDHLVTSKLKTLIWQDILDFRRKTFKFTTSRLIKEVRRCHDTTRKSHTKIKSCWLSFTRWRLWSIKMMMSMTRSHTMRKRRKVKMMKESETQAVNEVRRNTTGKRRKSKFRSKNWFRMLKLHWLDNIYWEERCFFSSFSLFFVKVEYCLAKGRQRCYGYTIWDW